MIYHICGLKLKPPNRHGCHAIVADISIPWCQCRFKTCPEQALHWAREVCKTIWEICPFIFNGNFQAATLPKLKVQDRIGHWSLGIGFSKSDSLGSFCTWIKTVVPCFFRPFRMIVQLPGWWFQTAFEDVWGPSSRSDWDDGPHWPVFLQWWTYLNHESVNRNSDRQSDRPENWHGTSEKEKHFRKKNLEDDVTSTTGRLPWHEFHGYLYGWVSPAEWMVPQWLDHQKHTGIRKP